MLILLLLSLEINQAELLDRCFKASYILGPFEITSHSLEKAEPSYSVNFEFLGSDSALLHLEAEFERHPGAQEYEVAQRRWVKVQGNNQHGDLRPPLQAAVIEFGRYASTFSPTRYESPRVNRISERTGS